MRKSIVLYSNVWATLLMLGFFIVSSLGGPGTFPGAPKHMGGLEHLQGKVVVLDPGHGGGDPGTVGIGPTTEAENVLAIAWELKTMLERYGAQVIMTRQTDASASLGTQFDGERNGQLAARVATANRSRGQIYISLHNDWHDNPQVKGTSVHYYKSQDLALAEVLQKYLVGQTKAVDLGVKRSNFYVLRNTSIPAALVEIGFLSNPDEARLMAKPSYRLEVVLGLLAGINAYFAGGL
ncbi:MAG TPA: N-acetylmuramoyl-L-alanine amidase [Limnochordia bacterium]|nr:N-acetylmuramoyl-L-alanine amidase [Limnochordia bacterium]